MACKRDPSGDVDGAEGGPSRDDGWRGLGVEEEGEEGGRGGEGGI